MANINVTDQEISQYEDERKNIASKVMRGAKNLKLKQQGHTLEARPYEFDEQAFQDPSKQQWQETLANRLQQQEGKTGVRTDLGQYQQDLSPMFQNIQAQKADLSQFQAPQTNVWGNYSANLNFENANQARQLQMENIQALRQQMAGQGPSVAQQQLAAGADRTAAQAMALARSGTGPRGLAQRTAQQQAGAASQALARDTALLRAQEQMTAQQQFGQAAQALTSQDISRTLAEGEMRQRDLMQRDQTALSMGQLGLAQAQMGQQGALTQQELAQQAGLAQVQAALTQQQLGQQGALTQDQYEMQQRQMNNQMVQYYLSQGMAMDQAQWQAAMQLEQLRASQHQAAQATQAGIRGAEIAVQNQPSRGERILGSVLQGAAGIGALFTSDERVKKDVKKASGDVEDFLEKLTAYKYKYKNKKHGETKKNVYGIMAQDLEKSKVGKTLVKEHEGVKMVDTIKGFGAVLAAAKDLHDRVKKLEGQNATA